MNLADFRATSKPVKRPATVRPLTYAEEVNWRAGVDIADYDVCTGAYVRMCVEGGEDTPDGLYAVAFDA